jgi:hypothetical protein
MVLLWPAQPVLALEFMQSGPKLVGSGVGPGQVQQGFSVALSADRRTAIVGGPGDDLHTGAAWVFTLGTTWTQQGNKLVGSTVGTSGPSDQGYSVALTADGNTALIGGPTNNGNVGAAWVFTRTNGVWTQQGGKLVGSDVNGNAQFGWSVALSADGNTALIGGPSDNIGFGAAWVFIRSGDPAGWFQQGAKLVGTTNTSSDNNPLQGNSVALSADGDFALVGAPAFDNQVGAVWAFSRNNGVWTQNHLQWVDLMIAARLRLLTAAFGRFCCKSLRAGPVELEFEIIESG